MPVLRANIFANYAGQIWMALMGVAFVPLYIRVLGMEAFGLVGVMLSLQAISSLFDLGTGGVLNRELARRSRHAESAKTSGDLVRTLEWLVWPIAIALALAIWLASSALANDWLHPQSISRMEAAHAIAIMGLAVALQWPSSFYASGMSGLERQQRLNVISAVFATLRGIGVLPVLFWVSPTIEAFLWWYAAMGAGQTLVSAVALWDALPKGVNRPKFDSNEIRGSGRFAGGLVAISALAVALTQLDRIVLSAMRPLEELGYFNLAMSVAAGLGRMVQPMFNALYPRFSKMVAANDKKALVDLYHLSNQCLTVVVAAVSAVLIAFSSEVAYLWTGDRVTAAKVSLPLSILVAGSALNGLMNIPYALQLAYGWTRLAVVANLAALIFGVPFCIWAIGHYGIVGAACLWLSINLGLVVFCVPLIHRRLMKGETREWYLEDIAPPAAAAALFVLLAKILEPDVSRDLGGVAWLAAVSLITLAASALSSRGTRQLLLARLKPAAH